MSAEAVLAIDVSSYQPHRLHRDDADWPETNCYVDVWIELLHAYGFDPLPALGFTIRTDLEADQWTFFKFRHQDVEALYGIEVAELNPWTSVLDQTVAEVRAGRPVLIEVDAFYLPDTVATSYQSKHVKTTVAVFAIDPEAGRLVYAHNRSVHELGPTDFDGIFRTPTLLPPYIEIARLGREEPLPASQHGTYAATVLAEHLRKLPTINPFARYRVRFEQDMERLAAKGVSFFHDYAFASYRQFGAAFSLAGAHLDWLRGADSDHRFSGEALGVAAEAFRSISSTARAIQMRSARTAMTGKLIDAKPTMDSLEEQWSLATSALLSGMTSNARGEGPSRASAVGR